MVIKMPRRHVSNPPDVPTVVGVAAFNTAWHFLFCYPLQTNALVTSSRSASNEPCELKFVMKQQMRLSLINFTALVMRKSLLFKDEHAAVNP